MLRSLHAHRPELLWLNGEQGVRTAGILIVAILLIVIIAVGIGLIEQTNSLLPRQ